MAAHFCPQCGQEVSSAARFCPNCAAPLGAPGLRPAPLCTTLDAAAQKSRRLLIPGLVAAVLVLALALIWPDAASRPFWCARLPRPPRRPSSAPRPRLRRPPRR